MALRKVGSDYTMPGMATTQAAMDTAMGGYETILNLNNNFAQISANITEQQIARNDAVAKYSMASAEAIGNAAKYKAQEFNQFTDTIQAGLKQQQDFNIRDEEAKAKQMEVYQKQEEERLEQLSQEEFTAAYVEMYEYTASADSYIQQSNPRQFINDTAKLLMKYQHLTPQQRKELLSMSYGAVDRVNQSNFAKSEKLMADAQTVNVAIYTERLNKSLSGITARIEAGVGNMEENLAEADAMIAEYLNNAPDLDQLGILKVYANALEKVSESTVEGSRHYVDIQAKVQNIRGLLSDERFLKAQDTYTNGGSKNDWDIAVSLLAAEYDLSPEDVGDWGDPMASQSELLRREQIQRQLKDLRQAGIIDEAENVRFNDTQIASLAWLMIQRPHMKNQLAMGDLKNNPSVVTAIELSNKIQEYEQFQLEVARKQSAQRQFEADFTLSRIDKEWAARGGNGGNNAVTSMVDLMKMMYPDRDIQAAPMVQQGMSEAEKQQIRALQKQWASNVLQEVQTEIALLDQELLIKAREMRAYGLLAEDGSKLIAPDKFQQHAEDAFGAITKLYEAYNTQNQTAPGGSGTGNFTNGGSELAKRKGEFATLVNRHGETMIVPFRASDQQHIRLGGGRGRAGTELHGAGKSEIRGRNHAGLDIPAPGGMELISMADSVVAKVGWDADGYGHYIDLKTATGTIHRFAHLQSKPYFKEGDRVKLGQAFGKVGTTGGSTGNHLHWEMRSASDYGYAGALDVEKIAADLYKANPAPSRPTTSNHAQPSGVQGGTTNVAPTKVTSQAAAAMNALHYLETGQWGDVSANTLKQPPMASNPTPTPTPGNPVPINSVYNGANPMKGNLARSDKSWWKPGSNKPDANYGYSALKNNPGWARKLSDISNRLGIPAQWLADIIAHESRWSPATDNGVGYKGFIQFGADTARRLGTSHEQLMRMSGEQQLEYVFKYLNQPEFQGNLKTIAHVLAAIWVGGQKVGRGGETTFQLLDTDPKRTLNIKDRWINFEEYLKRLGRDVGRKYEYHYVNGRQSRVAPIVHRQYVSGCSTCERLKSSGSFAQHEAT